MGIGNKKGKNIRLSDVSEGILADTADEKGISQNKLIDEIIKDTLISSNESVLWYANCLYRTDDLKLTITKTLAAVFEDYSGGANWESRYDNGLPLVIFAQKILRKTKDFSIDPEDDYYLDNRLDSVETKLKMAESPDETVIHNMIGKPITANTIYKFLSIMIDNWEYLGNWTIPYRFLCVALGNGKSSHNDTAEERIEFISVLNELSKKWD